MKVYTMIERETLPYAMEHKADLSFVSLNTFNRFSKRLFPDLKVPLVFEADTRDLKPPVFKNGLMVWSLPSDYDEQKLDTFWYPEPEETVSILMNTSMIDEPWCRHFIAPFLKSSDRVCVVALSYFDDTKNEADFLKQYGKNQGMWYRSNTDVFKYFGICAEQVIWLNPFQDSPELMAAKILDSTVLMLPGGAPDLFMKRLQKYKLSRFLKKWSGVIIGYSAGAMILVDDYHITPDEDYPNFSWHKGLGLLSGFDIEAHYRHTPHQKRHIERAREEKGLTTFAIGEKGGLVCHGDEQFMFGDVEEFY